MINKVLTIKNPSPHGSDWPPIWCECNNRRIREGRMSPRVHWSERHDKHVAPPSPTRRQVTASALQPAGLVAGLNPSREQISRSISVALAAFSFCPWCPLGQGQGDTLSPSAWRREWPRPEETLLGFWGLSAPPPVLGQLPLVTKPLQTQCRARDFRTSKDVLCQRTFCLEPFLTY